MISNYLKKIHFVKINKLSDGSKQIILFDNHINKIQKSTINEINKELIALYEISDLSFLKEEIQTILKDGIQNAIKLDFGDINIPNLSKIIASIMSNQYIIQITNYLTTKLDGILNPTHNNESIIGNHNFDDIINAWYDFVDNISYEV